MRRAAPGLSVAGLLAAVMSSAPALACGGGGGSAVALRAVTAQGDIATDAGLARFPGLLIPEATRGAANGRIAGLMAGQAAAADRWGRLSLSGDMALVLLAEGFAVTVAADAPPACVAAYLAAEARARSGRRGLWSDPAQLPADAARGEAVQALAGLHGLIEGRIAHVGWTRRAAYLNFGRPGEGASAELSGAVWRELERQGWTRETLKGQNVRVRGIVSEGRSGRVLIDSAAAIEWLK